MITDIVSQLRRDEGCRLRVYRDSVGKRTIGYGRCLDTKPLGEHEAAALGIDLARLDEDGITYPQAEALLARDVGDATADLIEHLPWTISLDDARRGVLINMCFNLGIAGLLTFVHMLAAAERQDWPIAAAEARDSTWRRQVGDRAERLATQLETGAWV